MVSNYRFYAQEWVRNNVSLYQYVIESYREMINTFDMTRGGSCHISYFSTSIHRWI